MAVSKEFANPLALLRLSGGLHGNPFPICRLPAPSAGAVAVLDDALL